MKTIEWIETENNCFECISHKAKHNFGYTVIRREKKNIFLHRYIYEQCFGQIPKNLVVRHKCDNPKCINPEHLETGTKKENSRDMVKRGRSIKGTKNPNHILTPDNVREIKSLIGTMKQTEIAKKFNVSPQTICDVKKGRHYNYVH